MDAAVWRAFQIGDFEPMLDRLTVRTASFAREVDGTTPLMAACARGNMMVVQLLLDLQCDVLAKDIKGQRAIDYASENGQNEIKAKVLKAVTPEFDEKGRPVFTWDKCTHPRESLHVDLHQGYLVCTACALILKENALQLGSKADDTLKMVTVRGADSEYNEWRSQELDLADAMEKLGVVDNEEALRKGKETSIWSRRERALAWLDSRRRIIGTHAWQVRARKSAGNTEQLPFQGMEAYTEDGEFRTFGKKRLLKQQPDGSPVVMFKGKGVPSVECAGDVDEEELIDLEETRKQYQSMPLKWTACKQRWGHIAKFMLNMQRSLIRDHIRLDMAEEYEESHEHEELHEHEESHEHEEPHEHEGPHEHETGMEIEWEYE